MTDCIFCKIIAGNIPSKKLAESAAAIAIADLSPQAPLHALILPRSHVASLNDLTAEQRRELLPELYALADELVAKLGLRGRGYRAVINNQEEGGQTVFHLHMHVLAGGQMRPRFGI